MLSEVSWLQFFTGVGLGLGMSVLLNKINSRTDPKPGQFQHEENPDADIDDEDSDWEDFSSNENDDQEDAKMVLAVRMDLKMGKGKIAAQCCHAALGAFKKAKSKNVAFLKHWEHDGSRKIAVKVNTEEELLTIYTLAKSLGLIVSIIQDAGRTQIEAGSKTVVGVFGPENLVDQVTRHLSLL